LIEAEEQVFDRQIPAALRFVGGRPGATIAWLTARRKNGRVVTLSPAILEALEQARYAATDVGLAELEVTCGPEGRHRRASLHYSGQAVDLRSRSMEEDQALAFVRSLRMRLGGDYDVVVEETHIHVEYQPKGPAERR